MNNDILIDQARDLYAVLHVEQYALSIENKTRFSRLDHIVIHAYCRYQRRLNRCAVCYQHRLTDCIRLTSKKNTAVLSNGHQSATKPRSVP
ncbi:MAG: hypothetical protein WAW61_07720 [Methylococcaceae bacterium]